MQKRARWVMIGGVFSGALIALVGFGSAARAQPLEPLATIDLARMLAAPAQSSMAIGAIEQMPMMAILLFALATMVLAAAGFANNLREDYTPRSNRGLNG